MKGEDKNSKKGLLKNPFVIEDLVLNFELDTDGKGSYFIDVFIVFDSARESMANIAQAAVYGYKVKRKNKTYAVSMPDIETLLIINSLNASVVGEEGRVAYEMTPSVLQLLRMKANVVETEASKAISILTQELSSAVDVDYNPQAGLVATSGFRAAGEEKLIPFQMCKLIRDMSYVRAGNNFYPCIQELDTRMPMDKPVVNIPCNQVPQFFKQTLPALGARVRVLLTPEAKKIVFKEGPFKLNLRLDIAGEETLELTVDYTVEGSIVPRILVKGLAGDYAQVDDYLWVKIDKDCVKKTEDFFAGLGAEEKEGKLRLPPAKYQDIKKYAQDAGAVIEETEKVAERLRTWGDKAAEGLSESKGPSFLSAVLKRPVSSPDMAVPGEKAGDGKSPIPALPEKVPSPENVQPSDPRPEQSIPQPSSPDRKAEGPAAAAREPQADKTGQKIQEAAPEDPKAEKE